MRHESSPLERYGHDLTRLATSGTFAPHTGDEAVVQRAFEVLQRTKRYVPLILADDPSRRWAIVAEVIRRMAIGDAPAPLCRKQVVGLDYEALFTDLLDDTLLRQERIKERYAPLHEQFTRSRAGSEEEWAALEELFRWPSLQEWIAPTMVLERLQSIFIAIHQAAGSIVLYVDHMHRLVGGEPDRYRIDAASLLKPALHRDHLPLIGTCTRAQYRQHIERDAPLQRACQEICVPETADAPHAGRT